jgi:hypothetical protein
VEASLRRDLPVITTPHATLHLQGKSEEEDFRNVYGLDFFENMMVDVNKAGGEPEISPAIKVTGMPGKHVPSGVVGTINDILKAVCPSIDFLKSSIAQPQFLGPTDERMDDRAWL